jgi:hypothetical protein
MRLGDTQTRTFIAGIVTANVNGATVEIESRGGPGARDRFVVTVGRSVRLL